MNTRNYIIGAIVLALIIIGWTAFRQPAGPTSSFDEDTNIEGDLAVEAAERIAVANGARIAIKGDLLVNGELFCESGSLFLDVSGDVTINNSLTCAPESEEQENESNITLIVRGSFTLAGDAQITADGNIQIVESEDLLRLTQEEIDALYDEIAQDSGEGLRVGPLVSEGASEVSARISEPAKKVRVTWRSFLPVAYAQAGSSPVLVSGKINVPTPKPGIKRIVVFNFPNATEVQIKNFELSGPHGRAGTDDKGASCNAKGSDGENAFRFLATAPNITVDNFTLTLGNGGKGGDAETKKECDPGVAIGGKGGKAGNFKMIAQNNFAINGSFTINPGKGGDGGQATANGKDGGSGEKGGDADATGGAGADNKKSLSVTGSIAGSSNVKVGSMIGGNGGKASANPGTGGDGNACGMKGGDGGNGTAKGGKGGNASLTLGGGATRTAGADDKGGDGGDGNAHGAKAGNGGSCDATAAGGDGGKGGDASAKPGALGSGQTPGKAGIVTDETGGDGGNGGDGCGPGNGGNGGNGNPPGKKGELGKNLCPTPKQPATGTTGNTQPTTGQQDPVEDKMQTPEEPVQQIQVIQYQGKYIPIDQLIIEPQEGEGCGADHWHTAEGVAIATDGTQIFEPGPPCGFGTTAQVPAMQIPNPAHQN